MSSELWRRPGGPRPQWHSTRRPSQLHQLLGNGIGQATGLYLPHFTWFSRRPLPPGTQPGHIDETK
jgi:hypothetical protein